MNEQERRAEILKAEEAIRQLGAEIVLAAEARSQAAEAEAALMAVKAELAELRRSLDDASARVAGAVQGVHESVSGVATTALTAAGERFAEAMGQVPGSVSKLETAATLVSTMPNQVAEVVKLELSATIAKLIEVSAGVKALSQQLVEIKQALSMDLDVKLRQVVNSTKWASLMATVAALAAIAAAAIAALSLAR